LVYLVWLGFVKVRLLAFQFQEQPDFNIQKQIEVIRPLKGSSPLVFIKNKRPVIQEVWFAVLCPILPYIMKHARSTLNSF